MSMIVTSGSNKRYLKGILGNFNGVGPFFGYKCGAIVRPLKKVLGDLPLIQLTQFLAVIKLGSLFPPGTGGKRVSRVFLRRERDGLPLLGGVDLVDLVFHAFEGVLNAHFARYGTVEVRTDFVADLIGVDAPR